MKNYLILVKWWQIWT